MYSFDDYLENYHGNEFSFDLLAQIIITTQQTKSLIFKEWDKITAFFKEYNPISHGFSMTNSEDYSFKPEYLVDSYVKIYNQVIKEINNLSYANLLDKTELIRVYYYYCDETILDHWEEQGIEYGSIDDNGIVNTGSCLTIQYFDLDWKIFLKVYKGIHN